MPPSTLPPDDFERLRNTLSLLAYEVPPPGYFDRFSGKVIARLEAGADQPIPTWWERLLLLAGARPWAAAAAALVAALLILAGLDRASAVHPSLAEVDPFMSGAPAALQAAILDWNQGRHVESSRTLGAGEIAGLSPLLPASAVWPPVAAPARPVSGLPASFTPAF